MRRNAQLSVRITDQEMANLRQLAAQESVLLSVLIRGLLAANSKQKEPANSFREFAAPDSLRPDLRG